MIATGRNVEMKARCFDLGIARDRAAALGARSADLLLQSDTYFRCHRGRLKLREFSDRPAELISYLRADQTGPRTSLFHRTLIPEPERLKPLLADALGLLGVVAKRRELWLFEPAAAVAVPHVRIHLDEVERLGTFLEFEAIMPATADDAAGVAVVEHLCRHFGLERDDFIPQSNIDLLLALGAPA